MKNLVNTYMEQFRQDRQKQLKLTAILAALAVVVAGVVFWQLHSTGVAMSNEVFCGQEEHIHDESCYIDGVLACGIPEHTHTVECLTDDTADVETEKDWEATLPEELSGVWADDVTAIAESQVGYIESERNFQLAEDGETRQGYTRYGAWYGNDYGDWDAMFVSFCLNYAGVPEDEVPESSGAYALAVAMTDMGICVYDDGFVPAAGDLVFFDTDEDETIDSVGIVKNLISGDTEITGIAVIEGNSNDAVEETEYDLNDPMIVAFGILPEQPEEETVVEIGSDISTVIDSEAAAATDVILANAEVDPETGEMTFQADGITYTNKTVNLWIHDSEGTVIGEYDGDDGLTCDVLVYTDPDAEEEYVLIPTAVFEDALTEEGYEFDDSDDCPFRYAAVKTAEDHAENSEENEDVLEACAYDSLTAEEETEWYVRMPADTDSDPDQVNVYYVETYAYSGDGSAIVVLNLGNGNGRYNFGDYAGNKSAGAALRYPTTNLKDYADTDGSLTINLPSDNDLPEVDYDNAGNEKKDGTKEFVVVDETGNLPDVTVQLGMEQAYDYKLVGWVNIATGEYYDVSEKATTAEINLDNENVFYADWIAATYDRGSSADKDLREDTVTTKDFVTVHMFDYNELFNLYSESLVQTGTTSEAWTDSGNLYNSLPYGTGNRLTSSFIFVNDGTTEQGYVKDANGKNTDELLTGGMLTWPNNKTAGNSWTGSAEPPRDAKAIWGITSTESPPLNMLFDTDEGAAGVHYLGEADYLFWIDDDGYYTYNSKKAAATYNQSEERFYVYDEPLYVVGTEFSCFLPFNDFAKTEKGAKSSENISPYNVNDGSVDYWFGMNMEVRFYLPADTGTGGNKVDEQDMVFNFSGDDDILIFIDNELVLDMSGIHDESFGSIDFTAGTVKMAMSESGLATAKATDLDIKAGNHTLDVYYMERGGYASNLEIQFNIAPTWVYDSGSVQTVTAEKVWMDSTGNKIDPADLPDVFKKVGVEVGLFDILKEGTDDTSGYTKDGDIYTFTYTDDNSVQHQFIFNAKDDDTGEPSLTYYRNKEWIAKYTNVSDGKVLDDQGYIVAWLESGDTDDDDDDDDENEDLLYIRIDRQTLNADNDWYYAWEMRDPDDEYVVLELTESSSYTTTQVSEELKEYMYWSVVGSDEIEKRLGYDEESYRSVILTEAAQEADSTIGDTKEAMGWVIVATENGIETEQIKFSQKATLEYIIEESSGLEYWYGVYGVTSQSEVNSLGSGAVWYMEDSGHADEDANGSTDEGFYLYCYLDDTRYYLLLYDDDDSAGLTVSTSDKSEFFYDSLGELMIEIYDNGSTSQKRVEILEDGTINIGDGEMKAASDDVRVYMLQDANSSGFAFTAYNSFFPILTINKVDSDSGDPLEGVSFTLTNDDGLYYAGINDGSDKTTAAGEIIWSESPVSVTTDEDGNAIFYYLLDGEYTLTEIKTSEGYNLLPSSITILIEDGYVGEADWTTNVSGSGYDGFIKVEDDGLTISVKNLSGMELPSAGGTGTWLYTVIGVCLIGGAAVTLVYRKRRAVRS